MSEMNKLENDLAKASDWVSANGEHPFSASIQNNIDTAVAMPDYANQMVNAIKAMLKDQAGNPFGRGNSVLNAVAKTTIDTGDEELADLLRGAVETHPTAVAMLLLTKRGEGSYENTDELASSMIGSAKRVLTERFKAKTWDGSVEGL